MRAEKPYYFAWLSMCTLCCCAGGPDSPSFCSSVWQIAVVCILVWHFHLYGMPPAQTHLRPLTCSWLQMNPDIADYMTTFIPCNVGGRKNITFCSVHNLINGVSIDCGAAI